jgi:hypothetical protein
VPLAGNSEWTTGGKRLTLSGSSTVRDSYELSPSELSSA